MSKAGPTKTGGRPAIEGIIRGRYSLSVGNPGRPSAPGWKWTKLTDLARLESGHTPSRRNPEYWDGDIPWIGIRDATANHGRTLPDTTQHVTQLGIENSSARVLPAQTVCLSRTASVGYVVVMGAPMATSQDFVNWVCGDHLDHRFLKYVLLAEKESYLSFASGTTHQTIYYPEVKAFHVCHPTVEKQQQIADVLQSIDDLIENNRRRIEILEEMAQAIYREWFVHFRFPGHETATFVDSPLGPIPEDWDVAPLEQIADVAWGDTKVTKKSYSATGFNAYSAAGRDGFLPYFDFDRSGVVIAAIGSVGRTWFVQGKWSCIKNTIRFWSLDSRTPDAYLYLATREPSFWPTRGAAQPFIALSDAKAVQVIVPSKSVAQGLDRFLSPLNRKALHCRAEVANLELSRDLLLPKLVSGEIDVCDLDLDAVLEGAV